MGSKGEDITMLKGWKVENLTERCNSKGIRVHNDAGSEYEFNAIAMNEIPVPVPVVDLS